MKSFFTKSILIALPVITAMSSVEVAYAQLTTVAHPMGNVYGGHNTGNNLTSLYLRNTFLGAGAGKEVTSGPNNIAIGYKSMYEGSVTGKYNTALGHHSLRLLTSGEHNIAIGESALNADTSGSQNIALGQQAIKGNRSGNENIGVGYQALLTNKTGNHNIAIGYAALDDNQGDDSDLDTLRGDNNIAIGRSALNGMDNGGDNIAIGHSAFTTNNTEPYYKSIAIGSGANIGGGGLIAHEAIALGAGARAFYSHGIAIGRKTQTQGISSITIGDSAQVGATGSSWKFDHAIALGHLSDIDSDCAIGVGHKSKVWTNSEKSIAIGCEAEVKGNSDNSMAMGSGVVVNGSNTVFIGNASVAAVSTVDNDVTFSDRRVKSDISSDGIVGIEFIRKLRPVTYNFNIRVFDKITGMSSPELDETSYNAYKKGQSGFIAQEVEAAAKKVGYHFNGVYKPQGEGLYGLRYATFVVPLVKAVQEQQEMIEASEAENEALRDELDELRAMVEDLASSQQRMDTDLQHCCLQYEGSSSLSGVEGNGNSASSGTQLEQPKLEQNQPNPFKENTIIKYYLPRSTGNAQLTVSSPDGKVLERFELDGKGFGQVLIHGGSLSPGTYIYTLEIAGQRVDSKRMILE